MHRIEQGGRGGAGQFILRRRGKPETAKPGTFTLGFLASRFNFPAMLSAVVVEQHVTTLDLSAWPRWLVVLCATLVVAFLIWVGIKLMKLAAWVFFWLVLIGGICWSAWLLIQSF
jgi:hypothetical protein